MPQRAAAHNATRQPRRIEGLPAGFAVVYLGRFLSNVAFRLVFPFLPRIADGLGTSLGALGTALAIRDLTGFATPVLGRTVDRIGRRRAMVGGMLALGLVMVVAAAADGLLLFALAMAGVVVAKNFYDIGSSAWIGDEVPFVRRGRAIGILETSWAVAFFVGMPLAALVIRLGTWRTPFLVCAVACVLVTAVVAAALDDGAGSRPAEPPATLPVRRLLANPALAGGAAAVAAIGVAHQMLLVTFASWLEDEHALSISGLGSAAIVIGVAEFAGSGGTAVFSDRIGPRRGVLVAAVALVPMSLTLPLGSRSLPLAFCVLAAWFVLMEFTFVTTLSLFTEIDPEARGAVMGLVFAAFTAGHASGAFLGAFSYETSGMPLVAALMAVAFAVAAGITWRWVHEPDDGAER